MWSMKDFYTLYHIYVSYFLSTVTLYQMGVLTCIIIVIVIIMLSGHQKSISRYSILSNILGSIYSGTDQVLNNIIFTHFHLYVRQDY